MCTSCQRCLFGRRGTNRAPSGEVVTGIARFCRCYVGVAAAPNCELVAEGRNGVGDWLVVLRPVKQLAAGSELLIDYGHAYKHGSTPGKSTLDSPVPARRSSKHKLKRAAPRAKEPKQRPQKKDAAAAVGRSRREPGD